MLNVLYEILTRNKIIFNYICTNKTNEQSKYSKLYFLYHYRICVIFDTIFSNLNFRLYVYGGVKINHHETSILFKQF
jgi:hypothetical protein